MGLFARKRKKDTAKKLKALLGDFELPSFSATVMRVLGLLRDPDASIEEIAAQVQIDPGMHVKTLSTVNAAGFGLASKVSDIRHAVSLLGRSRLESIILSIAVKDALPKIQSPHIDESRFWTTASERACLAGALAGHLHPATKAEAFVSAMLQDMAIPVIMQANQARYSAVIDQWVADGETGLDRIETRELGYDHTTVGALMAQEWHLPDAVVGAIRDHHGQNGNDSAQPAVKLVSHLRYVDQDKASALKEKCVTEYAMDAHHVDEMVRKALEDANQFSQ